MIRIIDTYPEIHSLFKSNVFSLEKWECYINSIYANSAQIFIDDLQECLQAGGYTYERDILPIIQEVSGHPEAATLHGSFCKVTDGLNKRVMDLFGREPDIDVVLYLGLCNAAGWVTSINGRDVILLGIEKILELNWHDEDSMRGLIYHELGHAYHKQYGTFNQHSDHGGKRFVWQLFTEGIAMYFEQTLVQDFHYYHQNRDGWLTWCEEHLQQISADFSNDLPTMTPSDQRYFGDWVRYHGKGDTGYFLGAKFVQQLCKKHDFERLINLHIDDVYREYLSFTESVR